MVDNGGRTGGEDATEKRGCSGRITQWATANLPFSFAILRCVKPILVLKELAIVTRFKDVQEVMTRDDAFMVTYADKMTVVGGGSNFFLGMGPSPQYQQDVSNMRVAFPRDDIEKIVAPLVDNAASEIVEQAKGRIDVARDLSPVVPALLVEQYMGITGPTREELIEWTTSLFYYLFFPAVSETASQQAVANAASLRARIDELIAARKQSGETKDDAIGRLLNMASAGLPPIDDVYIRNNLLGIIIGAIPTTSKAAALVLDYLLDHPEILARVRQAALDGDIRTLNKYVLECLRFNYFGPGLFRECIQDYKIAKGTWRGKTIRKGTRVLVATLSAMQDGRELTRPRRFDVDRPDYQYMHYGYGMHTCFGQYINNVQIATIVKSLLVKENLRRAEGGAGTLVMDERTFPKSFTVTYTP